MSELIYEHDFAREMLFAAIRCRTDSERIPAGSDCAEDITPLIEQALDAGCANTRLIVELANLGARLFVRSAADNGLAQAKEIVEESLLS